MNFNKKNEKALESLKKNILMELENLSNKLPLRIVL